MYKLPGPKYKSLNLFVVDPKSNVSSVVGNKLPLIVVLPMRLPVKSPLTLTVIVSLSTISISVSFVCSDTLTSLPLDLILRAVNILLSKLLSTSTP